MDMQPTGMRHTVTMAVIYITSAYASLALLAAIV